MRRLLAACVVAILAAPVLASYPARDLYVPIAGRGVGANGRFFYSTLSVTNFAHQENRVRVEFLLSAQPNPRPRAIEFVLQGDETRVFDPLGTDLLGGTTALGALHISAQRRVIASCRTYTRVEGEPIGRAVGARFGSIPSRYAVGNGEWTVLQGVSIVAPPQSSYRVYVVETEGHPLSYSIELIDAAGKSIAQKPFFIGAHEQRSIEIPAEFPSITLPVGLARIRGINGNGRIIAAGAEVMAESRDTIPHEMSFGSEPASRMPLAETVTYVVVGLAVIAAAWFYRR